MDSSVGAVSSSSAEAASGAVSDSGAGDAPPGGAAFGRKGFGNIPPGGATWDEDSDDNSDHASQSSASSSSSSSASSAMSDGAAEFARKWPKSKESSTTMLKATAPVTTKVQKGWTKSARRQVKRIAYVNYLESMTPAIRRLYPGLSFYECHVKLTKMWMSLSIPQRMKYRV